MHPGWRPHRRFLSGLLDLCFPRGTRCALCGAPLPFPAPAPPEAICGPCVESLPGIEKDYRPASAGHTGDGQSTPGGQPISRVRAVGLYRGDLKHAIWRLKYGGEQHLCEPLGALIARVAGDMASGAVIVPVPLHPAKEKRRGFNQALLLAKVVARVTGSVVEAGKLTRLRETLPQSSLKPEERRHNVEGAFRVAPAGCLRGSRILLVDDVFTTGSTVGECARTMLACGARSVDVVVCAVVEGSIWK